MYNHQKTTFKTKAANTDSIFDVDGSYFSMSRYNGLTQLRRIYVGFGLALLYNDPWYVENPRHYRNKQTPSVPLAVTVLFALICSSYRFIWFGFYDVIGETVPTLKSCCLTNLSGLGAHSSDSNGDLDITVAKVWMSGW